MPKTVGIGIQSFKKLIINHCFYIDKTRFIKEWWENQDDVTLITRPRRFGKTLNLDMLDCFFSIRNKDQGQIFENLFIGKEEKYRRLQGTYPVIFLSFADSKETTLFAAKKRICQIIEALYHQYDFLLDNDCLNNREKENFRRISVDMADYEAANSIKMLSLYLSRYYGKKVIIFMDEYDTPLQEAYIHDYWQEFVGFIRSFFNSTFKTNPSLERALLTGITRISKESIFSDLNNIEVITTTSEKYSTSFGFTEAEVAGALEQFGLKEHLHQVRHWYNGFCFGSQTNIYNPWSITKYLDTGKFGTYWANTSSNNLVGKLIREGSPEVKTAAEDLLYGKIIETTLDEEISFSQLEGSAEAVWSLLLASGYLKVEGIWDTDKDDERSEPIYSLSLTNLEIRKDFRRMIQSWFKNPSVRYNDFIQALLENNVSYMNQYMNHMAMVMFSFFDSGNTPSEHSEPERFYHGFVLGLIADAKLDYVITSNRESGLGRYDVVMEPKDNTANAYIFEFKVKAPDEAELKTTAKNALQQIKEKNYDAELFHRGIPRENIYHYGFAFSGKKVFILSD